MIALNIIILLGAAGRVLSIDQLLARWLPQITFGTHGEDVSCPALGASRA